MHVSPFRRTRGVMREDAGLTVIEMAIASTLLMVVFSFGALLLSSGQKSEGAMRDATQQNHNATVALEGVARSLREASYPQGATDTASSILGSASDYSVEFYGDPNNDGVSERVHYYLDASTNELERTITTPDCSVTPCSYDAAGARTSTAPVIGNVRNTNASTCGTVTPVFAYSNRDGSGQLTGIDAVQITLLLDAQHGSSPGCQTVTTSVSLRNWRG